MNKNDSHQLKIRVRKLLQDYPETRDNDMILFFKYWELHDKVAPYNRVEYDDFVTITTNPVSIHRVRAVIQNVDKEFVPSTWAVAETRKWNRKEWLEKLGYTFPDNEDQSPTLFGGKDNGRQGGGGKR